MAVVERRLATVRSKGWMADGWRMDGGWIGGIGRSFAGKGSSGLFRHFKEVPGGSARENIRKYREGGQDGPTTGRDDLLCWRLGGGLRRRRGRAEGERFGSDLGEPRKGDTGRQSVR